VTVVVSSPKLALTVIITALALAVSPAAYAGKGGGGTGTTTGGGTLALVLLTSTDGVAHWGQDVTFTVSTTATTRPYVALDCYQNGNWVSTGSVGYFADYAWPKRFTLASGWWTGGAATCTARLYSTNSSGTRTTTLATLSFPVYA
jgi:hypothetical protein